MSGVSEHCMATIPWVLRCHRGCCGSSRVLEPKEHQHGRAVHWSGATMMAMRKTRMAMAVIAVVVVVIDDDYHRLCDMLVMMVCY